MTNDVKKCLCDEPLCAKCLGVNCEDDNCKVHSFGDKLRAKRRILSNLEASGKEAKKTEIAKYRLEVERIGGLRK